MVSLLQEMDGFDGKHDNKTDFIDMRRIAYAYVRFELQAKAFITYG